MKKYFLIAFFFIANQGFSQNNYAEFPYNEVYWNIANTLAIASVEVGYSYFFEPNQSVGAKILVNDRINYHKEGKGSQFNTNSIQVNYTYFFGSYHPGSGVYLSPFLKYRFGNFKEKTTDASAVLITKTTNMDALMLGIGLGYKWNFTNSFVAGPFVNVARNFSQSVKNRFSAIEINAGFNIGYRF